VFLHVWQGEVLAEMDIVEWVVRFEQILRRRHFSLLFFVVLSKKNYSAEKNGFCMMMDGEIIVCRLRTSVADLATLF
jgi:hypothetical protein